MKKVLQQLNESVKLQRLSGIDADKVKNAFFANYLSALLMLKLQDLKGLMLINDRTHVMLTRFSDSMSDVNFWGAALFYPKNPEVKNRLAPGAADVLHAQSSHITDHRIQWIMKVPLTAPDNIMWMEAMACIFLMQHRYAITSSYFRVIVNALAKWDILKETDKKRAVNQAFMYLMQSDPKSKLLPRMRELSNKLQLKSVSYVAQTVVGFKRIFEDNAIVSGDAPAGDGGSGKSDATTVDNANTTLQGLFRLEKMSKMQVTKKGKYVFRDNKLIKKKTKKFKARKFKAPDTMKSLKMGASTYGVDSDSGE